ncbi:phosphinothricin acetyltransferase [Caulobacter ginsengisoli]|uniref:Phosphinothricin acetyltransferase n=1 Tax=Caulobacter ginsengisoli TaxID=400775 RepID=A0ABU0IQ19_9CAUL|nr:phosphinothricin acetyltransferase [Caulobacter ginsengisoli]
MTLVRAATPQDAGALAAIYGHACLHGFGTFEEAAPTPEEMAGRMAAIQARGLPYLVAEVEGEVLAMAYAGPFRPRAAYRYSVEDSVYVSPRAQGQGLGRLVLSAVIDHCEGMALRQMMAVIGDSENLGSIRLHESLGFVRQGVMRSVGYKHGRWLDIVMMQRPLNSGDASPPDAGGLQLSGF